jgi:hypothetical protein
MNADLTTIQLWNARGMHPKMENAFLHASRLRLRASPEIEQHLLELNAAFHRADISSESIRRQTTGATAAGAPCL